MADMYAGLELGTHAELTTSCSFHGDHLPSHYHKSDEEVISRIVVDSHNRECVPEKKWNCLSQKVSNEWFVGCPQIVESKIHKFFSYIL